MIADIRHEATCRCSFGADPGGRCAMCGGCDCGAVPRTCRGSGGPTDGCVSVDDIYMRELRAAVRDLSVALSAASAGLRDAVTVLGRITRDLYAVEYAEGDGDIAAWLADAARAVRAAQTVHLCHARASGVTDA